MFSMTTADELRRRAEQTKKQQAGKLGTDSSATKVREGKAEELSEKTSEGERQCAIHSADTRHCYALVRLSGRDTFFDSIETNELNSFITLRDFDHRYVVLPSYTSVQVGLLRPFVRLNGTSRSRWHSQAFSDLQGLPYPQPFREL